MTANLAATTTLMRQWSELLSGGISLAPSLDILLQRADAERQHEVLRQIKIEIESGKSVSEALANFPTLFSPIHIGLVRAGERSGRLEHTIAQVSQLMQTQFEARQKWRLTLAYPLIVLGLALVVCVFLTFVVIPRFQFLFADLGQQLPMPTRLLIGVSTGLRSVTLPLGLACVPLATFAARKKHSFSLHGVFRLLKPFPFVRELLRSTLLHSWFQMSASLLEAGLPLPEVLELTSTAAHGGALKEISLGVLRQLERGFSVSESLAAVNFFPPHVCALVQAAEEAGSLEPLFGRLAESFEKDVTINSKLLFASLEPALIVGLGVGVGFVALAMLLPIFSMSANLR